jgi:hypothetical protein
MSPARRPLQRRRQARFRIASPRVTLKPPRAIRVKAHPMRGTCSFTGDSCVCQLTMTIPADQSRSYTVSGAPISEVGSDSHSFCVNGNTMSQRGPIGSDANVVASKSTETRLRAAAPSGPDACACRGIWEILPWLGRGLGRWCQPSHTQAWPLSFPAVVQNRSKGE